MRGLTDEERWFLTTTENITNDELAVRLEARGLMVESNCGCGGPIDCQCSCSIIEMRNTAAGDLALRLDAAARALGGVNV